MFCMSNGKRRPEAGTRKLAAGGLAGAIATVLVWLITVTTGVEIPSEVSTAIGTILTVLGVYSTPEVYYYVDDE